MKDNSNIGAFLHIFSTHPSYQKVLLEVTGENKDADTQAGELGFIFQYLFLESLFKILCFFMAG